MSTAGSGKGKTPALVASLASIALPLATTTGWIQYSTGGKSGHLNIEQLRHYRALLTGFAEVLQRKRLTVKLAEKVIRHIISMKGWMIQNEEEAITQLADRLRTLVCHYYRARNAGKQPKWYQDHFGGDGQTTETRRRVVKKSPPARDAEAPTQVVTKRPAAAALPNDDCPSASSSLPTVADQIVFPAHRRNRFPLEAR